jgi:hypothetical protein
MCYKLPQEILYDDCSNPILLQNKSPEIIFILLNDAKITSAGSRSINLKTERTNSPNLLRISTDFMHTNAPKYVLHGADVARHALFESRRNDRLIPPGAITRWKLPAGQRIQSRRIGHHSACCHSTQLSSAQLLSSAARASSAPRLPIFAP